MPPKPNSPEAIALESSQMASEQQWMMAAITAPGGLPQGLARARDACGWEIGEVIEAPAGISPQGRLDIYARGYWLRLIDCLKADYPALRRLLGETLFDFFARAYLDQHPSQSFSLYGLGDGFPQFLRRSQSAAARDAAGGKLRLPWELARIEQARAASLRASGVEREAIVPVDTMQLLQGASVDIELPATTRLLLASHPFEVFRPWLEGVEPGELPASGVGRIVVRRQRYRVSCEELADWQFHFLAAARRGRRPLLTCAAAATRCTGRPISELLAKLAFWLPAAQTSGLVRIGQAKPQD